VNRKQALALSMFIVAGYLVAGLRPFNFNQPNTVSWLARGKGIHLSRYSVVSGALPRDDEPSLPAPRTESYTIELYVEADKDDTRDTGALLSFFEPGKAAYLVLSQWKSTLLMQVPAGARGFRQIGAASCLIAGKRRFLAATSGSQGCALFLDGVLAKEDRFFFTKPGGLRGQIMMGNTPGGRNPWEGKVFGLGLFNRRLGAAELTRHRSLWENSASQAIANEPGLLALYLFDEGSGNRITDRSGSGAGLIIPPRYQMPQKAVLLAPWQDSFHGRDFAVNVLGFIPFGFIFFVYRNLTLPGKMARNMVLTLFVAAAISLSIELLQIYLPSRTSSLTDFLCNFGGALIGATLALAGWRTGLQEFARLDA
jgi:hypothetical protein